MLAGLLILSVFILSLFLSNPDKTWKPMKSFFGFGALTRRANDNTEKPSDGGRKAESTSGAINPQRDSMVESTASEETDEDDDGESTPRARPADSTVTASVPYFNLESEEDAASDDETDTMPPPSFPAPNSAQRAAGTPAPRGPPKLKPLPQQNASMASQRMPPPPPRALIPDRAPLLSPQGALRAPTAGTVPNRGPPTGSSGLMPPPFKTTNARNKVMLAQGRSPLDWASLQKSGKNLSGVDKLIRVTPSMLKFNNGRKGRPCWSSYGGKVFNIGPYLEYHPGGEGELRRASGKDGEKLFMEVHPWVNWENMLGECLVGIVVSEDDARAKEQSSPLDEMD